MNILTKLLPTFLSELQPKYRRPAFAVLAVVGLLMFLDYCFASQVAVWLHFAWLAQHRVPVDALVAYVGISGSFHVVAHKNVPESNQVLEDVAREAMLALGKNPAAPGIGDLEGLLPAAKSLLDVPALQGLLDSQTKSEPADPTDAPTTPSPAAPSEPSAASAAPEPAAEPEPTPEPAPVAEAAPAAPVVPAAAPAALPAGLPVSGQADGSAL